MTTEMINSRASTATEILFKPPKPIQPQLPPHDLSLDSHELFFSFLFVYAFRDRKDFARCARGAVNFVSGQLNMQCIDQKVVTVFLRVLCIRSGWLF